MTIHAKFFQRRSRRLKMCSSLICLAAVLLLGGCKSSRQPPEGTPIIHETRVWMLGDPNSAQFVAVVSPWTYWFEYFYFGGFGGRDRIMLEQTAHVFLCDAATGSVLRAGEIRIPEEVDGFKVKFEGVRCPVIGWDADAAYIELRAEPTRGDSREPTGYAWYRIAKDGNWKALTEHPTGLTFINADPVPVPGNSNGFPFPSAAPYRLVREGDSIRLSYAGVWIVEFSIDPITCDLRPVDLGPDSKRYLREAMEAANGDKPKRT